MNKLTALVDRLIAESVSTGDTSSHCYCPELDRALTARFQRRSAGDNVVEFYDGMGQPAVTLERGHLYLTPDRLDTMRSEYASDLIERALDGDDEAITALSSQVEARASAELA